MNDRNLFGMTQPYNDANDQMLTFGILVDFCCN